MFSGKWDGLFGINSSIEILAWNYMVNRRKWCRMSLDDKAGWNYLHIRNNLLLDNTALRYTRNRTLDLNENYVLRTYWKKRYYAAYNRT